MVNYKKASFTLTGITCTVYFLRTVFWNLGEPGHSLVPGWDALVGLVAPILAAWAGTLIRHWRSYNPIISGILAAAALYLIGRYAFSPDIFTITNASRICYTSLVLGYLIPESLLESFSDRDRLLPNGLLFLVVALSYTCAVVVCERVLLYPFPVEQAPMQQLIYTLLQVTKGVLTLASVFLSLTLAFSPTGQKIGANRWVRLVFIVISVLASLFILRFALDLKTHIAYVAVRSLSCPLVIYLMVVACRLGRMIGNRHWEGWKGLFSL